MKHLKLSDSLLAEMCCAETRTKLEEMEGHFITVSRGGRILIVDHFDCIDWEALINDDGNFRDDFCFRWDV